MKQLRIRSIELSPDNAGAFVTVRHEIRAADGTVTHQHQESRVFVDDREALRAFVVGDVIQPFTLELVA
jgi:hypothetical protein